MHELDFSADSHSRTYSATVKGFGGQGRSVVLVLTSAKVSGSCELRIFDSSFIAKVFKLLRNGLSCVDM